MNIIKQLISTDGITQKFLQSTTRGETIETVVVERPEKRIVCFSTQVGCSMGCSICAVSRLEYIRNLTKDEITEQCLNIISDKPERPTLFSAMGTGEPTLNHHLIPALLVLSQHGKLALSTIGINLLRVFHISQSLREHKLKIQLSIHAPDDLLRRKLLDNRLPSLVDTLDVFSYLHHPVEYNYTLLSGINDTDRQALQLTTLLLNQPGKVKLNRYNPISSAPYVGSSPERVKQFISILNQEGIDVEAYQTDGVDIEAACGQLIYSSIPKLIV